MIRKNLSWKTAYWAVVGLVLGGIVHIATVLAAPRLIGETAWQKIGKELPVNSMHVLPLAAPGALAMPFMTPDVGYALCRFDLSRNALNVRTTLLNAAWSVTFFTRHGESFFAMTSADLQRNTVDLTVLAPETQSLLDQLQGYFSRPKHEVAKARKVGLSIRAPVYEGFALVRAPILGVSYANETMNALREAVCSSRDGGGA
jgi:uncharacterized membrane protein